MAMGHWTPWTTQGRSSTFYTYQIGTVAEEPTPLQATMAPLSNTSTTILSPNQETFPTKMSPQARYLIR